MIIQGQKWLMKTVKSLMHLLLCIIGICLLPGNTALAADLPVSNLPLYTLNYTTNFKSFDLDTKRTLQFKDGRYFLDMQSHTFMLTSSESSAFQLQEDKILPLAYKYALKVAGHNNQRKNTYDHAAHTATFIKDDDKDSLRTVNTPEQVYDVLNYQEKIRLDYLNGKGLAEDNTFVVFDRGRMKDYHFRILAEEVVKTPIGNLNAIKIERVRDTDKIHTYIWLAKDWSYIILKILHQEEGEADYNLNLEDGNIAGKEIVGLPAP